MKNVSSIHPGFSIIFVLSLFLISAPAIPFDPSRQVVMPCQDKTDGKTSSGCWTLVPADADAADKILIDHITVNKPHKLLFDELNSKGLGNYFRQYRGIAGDSGAKLVHINCLCKIPGGNTDWKRSVILVLGGGHCYFNATINLTSKKCEAFHVNSQK